jgi:hypothetical protein
MTKWSYYPRICLKGLRKAMEDLNQYSQCSGRDSNQAPSEYGPTALPLHQPFMEHKGSFPCSQEADTRS